MTSRGQIISYAEVLTSGHDFIPPSVLFSVERRGQFSTETKILRRYIFGAPEEIIRFSGSHGIKLPKVSSLFLCNRNLSHCSGLPELVLSLSALGVKEINVAGPKGVGDFVNVCGKNIFHGDSLTFHINEVSATASSSGKASHTSSLTSKSSSKRTKTHEQCILHDEFVQVFAQEVSDGSIAYRIHSLVAPDTKPIVIMCTPNVAHISMHTKFGRTISVKENNDTQNENSDSDHGIQDSSNSDMTFINLHNGFTKERFTNQSFTKSGTNNIISAYNFGRRRGLYKLVERLEMLRTLVPELCVPRHGEIDSLPAHLPRPSVLTDAVNAALSTSTPTKVDEDAIENPIKDSSQVQEINGAESRGAVFRLYQAPTFHIEEGIVENFCAADLKTRVESELDEYGLTSALADARSSSKPQISNSNQSSASNSNQSSASPSSSSSSSFIPFIRKDGSNASRDVCVPCPPKGQVSNIGGKFLKEIVFLGTGSAKPSSKRGQSGILVKWKAGTMLVECGGGTLSMLSRLYGEKGCVEVLKSIGCIWISHHHADHMEGLPRVCVAMLKAHDSKSVVVVAPDSVRQFLLSAIRFSHPECESRLLLVDPIELNSLDHPLRKDIPVLSLVESVPVYHSRCSYGLILRAGDNPNAPSEQLVFSGDCRPCHNLAALALDDRIPFSVLIHEATFDDSMSDDARRKKHSTVAEAISIGRRMNATHILLTHFSQRYPSIKLGPATNTSGYNYHDRVGVCFDGLCWTPQVAQLLNRCREPFEQYWQARHEAGVSSLTKGGDISLQPAVGEWLPLRSNSDKIKIVADALEDHFDDHPILKTVESSTESTKISESILREIQYLATRFCNRPEQLNAIVTNLCGTPLTSSSSTNKGSVKNISNKNAVTSGSTTDNSSSDMDAVIGKSKTNIVSTKRRKLNDPVVKFDSEIVNDADQSSSDSDSDDDCGLVHLFSRSSSAVLKDSPMLSSPDCNDYDEDRDDDSKSHPKDNLKSHRNVNESQSLDANVPNDSDSESSDSSDGGLEDVIRGGRFVGAHVGGLTKFLRDDDSDEFHSCNESA